MDFNKSTKMKNDLLIVIIPILIKLIEIINNKFLIRFDTKLIIILELIFWLYLAALFLFSYNIGKRSFITTLIIKGCDNSPGIDGKLVSYFMSFILLVIAIIQFLYLSNII
ncbi:MAG: hypothetical protein ACFFDN_42630 [Candidatus Hodarchaeota archaeon]